MLGCKEFRVCLIFGLTFNTNFNIVFLKCLQLTRDLSSFVVVCLVVGWVP